MASAKREVDQKERSSELVPDLYSNLVLEIWEIASELIGEAILALLFNLAIRNLGDKYPFLKSLDVSEEGISVDRMRGAWRNVSPPEIHRGVQSFITYLLDLFSALAEGVVSRELFPKVFPKVREAERLISQK